MNKIIRLSLILIFTICSLQAKVFGQTNPYVPKIIPPSPNAASLGKFGDIPVSPYTGATDVSIPIYTIQAKGVSVPVSLSYHTGGIRLSEEAGWVGLGWALNAGGMISRTINDKDDFISTYFNANAGGLAPLPDVKGKMSPHPFYHEQEAFNIAPSSWSYVPKAMGPYGYDFGCNYNVYSSEGTYNFWPIFQTGDVNNYDMEPDSYTFNFPAGSGKFIIGRDGKVVLQKQENLQIKYAADGSSFTIRDQQGNNYFFQDKEYNQPAIGGAQHISSWLLSQIITQQQDTVLFNYFTDNTWSTVKGITHETNRIGCAGNETPVYSNDPGQSYLNKTLQSIDYKNAQVQFSFDGFRSDLQNGKKLNGIKIYSKDQSGLKYLKEEQLFYSYFNTVFSDTLEFGRLRLDSVREVSGTNVLPGYSFSYNIPAGQQNFMGKHYSSVDHWGYFSGRSNAVNGDYTLGFTAPFTGIVNIGDNFSGNVNIPQYINLSGANREPDSTYMKAFSLSRVNYPTGGYTLFQYDPNYYDYDSSNVLTGSKDFEYLAVVDKVVQFTINTNGTTSGTIDFSRIFQTSSLASNGTLSIGFRAANSDSLNKYHNNLGYGKINFTFQNNVTDISSATMNCSGTMNGSNCSGTVYGTGFPITISSASIYNWSAYIDPMVKIPNGFMDINVTFTYKEPLYKNTTMLMAGGLRVKSITDYDVNGKMAKKRIYQYDYSQDRNGDHINETYSFGRMMGYISYARYEPYVISVSGGGNAGLSLCQSLTRYSSNFSAFTSQSSGNIVGYDQVTEYEVDSTGLDNGSTVYNYYNSSDTSFSYAGARLPGVLNLANNLNGVLKFKTVYRRTGSSYQKVSRDEYYYRTANRIIYNSPKCLFYGSDGHGISSNSACPNSLDSLLHPTMAFFYPSIHSERVLMDSSRQIMFDQNDTNKAVTTTSYNYYDNAVHYQPTRLKSIDSKGNTSVSLMKYPQDYIPNGSTTTGNTILDSMINRNMVSEVIEKRDSLYYTGNTTSGKVKGAQLTKYKLASANNSVLTDKQYRFDQASPVSDFQGFSINGNITSQDSRYRQLISFDNYDTVNNIIQYTTTDQTPVAIRWGYNNIYPVAKAKNATNTLTFTPSQITVTGTQNLPPNNFAQQSVNFTSKYNGTITVSIPAGSFLGSGGTITVSVGFTLIGPSSQSATMCITNSPPTCSNPSSYTFNNMPAGNYTLNYNAITNNATSVVPIQFTYPGMQLVSSGITEFFYEGFEENAGAITGIGHTGNKYWNSNYTVPYTIPNGRNYIIQWWSFNGIWNFHQQSYTSNMILQGPVDDIRVFPSDAQIASYTYTPLVGTASETDPAGKTIYYEYDNFQRLKNIRDDKGNIIKNFQYNYANSCGNNCFIIPMQTFNGGNTLSYPVGVFNANGKLLGNAISQAQYVTLWNSDTADQHRGALVAGSDSMHFKLTVISSSNVPSAVTGCRYFQYDLAYNLIDGIRNRNGCYIDFGDGTGMALGKSTYDTTSMTIAPNTTIKHYLGGPGPYFDHTYPDNSLKTLTFYHNDANESPSLDNALIPATSLTLVKNFRGFCPQNMTGLGGSCYQQTTATTVANIVNWNSINTVLAFVLNPGDAGITPIKNVSYAQDFMANNKGLQLVYTAYGVDGVVDSIFKISRLKSDWNTYFTQLSGLIFNDDNWNRENLSSLLLLSSIQIYPSLKNPTAAIPSSVIDNVINQIGAGSGQFVSNGLINLYNSRGGTRTSASDASFTFLKSKGWTILINGVTY